MLLNLNSMLVRLLGSAVTVASESITVGKELGLPLLLTRTPGSGIPFKGLRAFWWELMGRDDHVFYRCHCEGLKELSARAPGSAS